MIQLVPQLKILLAYEPVDFRKGIDSLVALCKTRLDQDPFSGTLFVFRNRSGTALKLLVYDGQGFWLCLKRFSKGRLHWWPSWAAGRDSTSQWALEWDGSRWRQAKSMSRLTAPAECM